MTKTPVSQAPKTLLDRSDSRVTHAAGIGGTLRQFLDQVRAGDLGSLPVIVGLAIIWTVFSTLNPVFLSSNNLVNLLFDCSTVGVIALGIVCVLMLGEIDLSVGSMSGVASALIGVIWVKLGAPLPLAIMAALALGALMGALYATLRTRLGMPSFVSTLSGLMALLGLQLYLLGSTGSINLPYGSWMVSFGQLLIMPDWLSHTLALVPGAVLLILGMRTNDRRRQANLSAGSLGGLLLKVAAVTIGLEAAVWYLNLGRGIPWMFGLFVLLVVGMNYAFTRTKWGRSMMAVGGNAEAARRAGINVRRIYLSAFMLCSMFAASGFGLDLPRRRR
ncbi:ABC transporter permease [Amaricoccus sp. HAR-UPW-R2A-40]|nr:ABC transporter permease [Amaricoccus sp. HAR-UPW-R2A-40]